MNNKENNVEAFINRKVIVKFVNGRTISGLLKNDDLMFTIKLGVKHIIVNPIDVVHVTELI